MWFPSVNADTAVALNTCLSWLTLEEKWCVVGYPFYNNSIPQCSILLFGRAKRAKFALFLRIHLLSIRYIFLFLANSFFFFKSTRIPILYRILESNFALLFDFGHLNCLFWKEDIIMMWAMHKSTMLTHCGDMRSLSSSLGPNFQAFF